MKTMCPPGYHHNGFVATHALGHMIYGCIMRMYNIHIYVYIYIYIYIYIIQANDSIMCGCICIGLINFFKR